jgi:hypothetical protein
MIQPSADPAKTGEKTFAVSLRRGVVTWANFYLALFLLLIYPLCVCLKSSKFEAQRNTGSSLASKTEDSTDDEGGE